MPRGGSCARPPSSVTGGTGLGEWDVRSLAGHTSRALVTVETYLARPASAADLASATGYFRSTRAAAADAAVVARGRDAGAALGSDPAGAGFCAGARGSACGQERCGGDR
jgi:hypothetical protein